MNIRLKEFEIAAIIESFSQTFMSGDNLWTFGSRADLNQYECTSEDTREYLNLGNIPGS